MELDNAVYLTNNLKIFELLFLQKRELKYHKVSIETKQLEL